MMRISKQLLLICTAGLLVLAAACAPAATPAPTAVPPSPTAIVPPTALPATTAPTAAATTAASADEVTGGALFLVSCSECHGQDHAGQTFDVDGQTIDVPSLAWDELIQMYATDPNRGTVDQQFAVAITKGLDEEGADLNPMMPHWTSLSQTQIDSLIQYLQSSDTAPTMSPAAMNLMGEQLFQAACAACHGEDGAGKTFEDGGNKIDTPSLSWSDMTEAYSTDTSRGTVEQQLALAITKGLDETGDDLNPMMPHWTSLSQAQVDSLIQYIKTTFK